VSTLTISVVAADRADFDCGTYFADVLELVENPGARLGGYGALGQHLLERCETDVFGLVHADTRLSTEVCESLTAAAMAGAVAGIVGRSLDRRYVWSRDVAAPTPVSTLDSCSLFVSTALVRERGLSFDTVTFDDFHLCVEDFCLQATRVCVPIVVAPGPASHAGQMYVGANRDAWREQYKVYRARLNEKWRGTEFTTT
jgi:hypothetical protein